MTELIHSTWKFEIFPINEIKQPGYAHLLIRAPSELDAAAIAENFVQQNSLYPKTTTIHPRGIATQSEIARYMTEGQISFAEYTPFESNN